MKSSLKAELSNTVLGYLWWLLDPLLHMIIYTFVVQVIFKRADFAFPLYLFCALLPWKVASVTLGRGTSCVRANAGIVKQVYLPHFILTLVIIMTNTVKLGFGLLLLLSMVLLYKIPLSWHLIEIIPVYIVFFLFYWSLSLFLTHMGVLFEDMSNLISYVLMFWFYASPSMWYLKMLSPENLKLMAFNPNTTFFTSFRQIFMHQSSPDYKMLGIWLAVSLVILWLGIILLYKSEKNYSKAI
ncbi:MAG: ABC transporter permease [Spirochaetaceae bacterium]|nr:ABC transporter permease [Spirochaetaceae bacterium]